MTSPQPLPRDIDILIVEDSATQAEQLRQTLEQHGYRVTVSHDGREALQVLEHHRPTLIISDILMPQMDGFELCRRVRSDARLAGLPLILLTALTDPQDVLRGLECGADNFITKPYDDAYLLSRIRNILRNLEQRGSQQTTPGTELAFRGEHYVITSDRQQILELLLSTYETATEKNRELIDTQEELRELNLTLERKVEARTAELHGEIARRTQIEKELREAYGTLEKTLTALRATQKQVIQSEKLAALGTLAAGVAHELNNPLMGVMNYVDFALGQVREPEIRYPLERAEQELRRIRELLRSMLTFARPPSGNLTAVALNEVLARTVELLAPEFRADQIAFTQEVPDGLPPVTGQAAQLQQVFLNLLLNARDAVAGSLEKRVNLRAWPAEEAVLVEIRDSGEGIPEASLGRIFDPFFTTRPPGKGTGMGLSVVQGIITEMGGIIEVDSRPGEGAMFTVKLPISQPVEGAQRHAEADPGDR